MTPAHLHLSDTYSEKSMWHCVGHFIWHIYSWLMTLSGILSDILSGKYSGSDILPGILFWHVFWILFLTVYPTWHFFWHSVWLNAERTLYSLVIFYLFYWGQTTVGVTCAYMYASPSKKLYVCSPLLHCSVFLPKCTHECTWRKT